MERAFLPDAPGHAGLEEPIRTDAKHRAARGAGHAIQRGLCPSPVCSPTRISLQTGRNPAVLGWTKAAPAEQGHRLIEGGNRKSIRGDEITIGQMRKSAGYATAHFGKWHLSGGGPAAHGYDESDGDTGNHDAAPHPPPNPVDIFGMGLRAVDFMKRSQAARKPFFIQMSYHALHYPETGGNLLFDLVADRGEQNNLIRGDETQASLC